MKRKKVIGLIIPLIVIVGSCVDEPNADFNTVYYHPSYSLPIGKVKYSINELMFIYDLNEADPAMDTADNILYYNNIKYEVPVGRVGTYQTAFEVPADLSELSRKGDQVTSLLLRINTTNNIPVPLSFHVHLMENEEYLETIPERWFHVDARNDNNKPSSQQLDIDMDKNSIANMLLTDQFRIVLNVEIHNFVGDTVQLYNHDSLHIQLAIRAGLSLPL